jgi:CRP-like cAMP-binding protein
MSRYLVAGLSDADMVWLLSCGKLRTLRAGERLVEIGRPFGDLFFILAGTLEVVRGDGTHIATIGAGEVVGEMSFVDDQPPSVSVRASEATEVLCTPRSDILARFGSDALFAARFYRALAKFLSDRLRETTRLVGVALPAGGTHDPSIIARFRRLLTSHKGAEN